MVRDRYLKIAGDCYLHIHCRESSRMVVVDVILYHKHPENWVSFSLSLSLLLKVAILILIVLIKILSFFYRSEYSDNSMTWFDVGKTMYKKTFKKAKYQADLNSKKTDSNAASISLVSGQVNLAAQQGRLSVRAITWKFFVEKLNRALMNPELHYLTRDMLTTKQVDSFIRSRNEELKASDMMVCVTKNSAFRHG